MDLFKRIQNLSAVYDDDGPSATVQESRPMFNNGGMLVQPSNDGSRPGYNGEGGAALLRSDREYAGDVVDESFKISDDVIEEAMSEAPSIKIKKASGGIARMLGE